jgi:hypothetical protein
LALAVLVPISTSLAAASEQAQGSLTDLALDRINEVAAENRANFYLYKDVDSGMNHGFPSGYFGALPKIRLHTGCVPADETGCRSETTSSDLVRRTVMEVRFDPLAPGEYAGINIEEPENFGAAPRGHGYDLRPAARVCLEARSSDSGFKVQFGVAGRVTSFLQLPRQWTTLCFDLASDLGLTPADLADVQILFTIVTNDHNALGGGSVLLDDIRFEPAPDRQRTIPSFPLANAVLGVVPVQDELPGRVKIPPDQINGNLTTVYESALAVLALLARGNPEDLDTARWIADALVYALENDNAGLAIPPAPAGHRGLHSAYSSGDLPLNNAQPQGALDGQIRLSGFSASDRLCGPTRFCVVLDGATGGNNAFAIYALAAAYRRLGDDRYLQAAIEIGNWIHASLLDATGTGFGGYFLGYPDQGLPKTLLTGKSIENNADIFRAFQILAEIKARAGQAMEAAEWRRRARIAGDFVLAMFDAQDGRFFAGTVPVGTPPGPGIRPDGPSRGDDVVNTYEFLDAQTFTTLAMGGSLYRRAIDWRRPVHWMLDRFSRAVVAGGERFEGFSLVEQPDAGPDGVAWEFTAQAVLTMRYVDALYCEQRFEAQAQHYLEEIRKAQLRAPFGDGRGVVAATMESGDALHPYEQCLSTPFQCIAQRVGLAATTWAIYSDLGRNPFEMAADVDGDQFPDAADNCIYRPNATQFDADSDGYGNICDADLNNDQLVDALDLGLFRDCAAAFSASCDFDADGRLSLVDVALLKSLFGKRPGPSAQACR